MMTDKSNTNPRTTAPRHILLLASTSVSVLAYEILLMRLLAIGQWHHFAYMVISVALLGFGAAGSLLFLFFDKIRENTDQWLTALSGAAAVSLCLAFSVSQKIGLDPLQVIWQPLEWLRMLLTYLLMAVPFLLAGGIVGIILTGSGRGIHRMYAVDLLGAGCGAFAIIPALYAGPPWILLPVLGGVILVGSMGCCLRAGPILRLTSPAAAAILAVLYLMIPPIPKIHDTKGLPQTLLFPDARIEVELAGPLGVIHVVGSTLIRHVPGLSLNFGQDPEEGDVEIPEQKAIFIDGDGLSPMSAFSGDPDALKYLDYTTMSLPYHVRKPVSVLSVGTGGGTDLLLGILHHTPEIVALEANRQVADLLRGPFAGFTGDLLSGPGIKLVINDARRFLQATEKRFDLIQISLLDSFGTSATGLQSAAESYLYTREAFELYLSRLSDKGMLSITRWLKLPPRDSLRILSTALAALKGWDHVTRPEAHLIFIRSWKTGTILLSRAPFTPGDINRVKAFCAGRSFDVAYYNGMTADEANRFDIHRAPYYFIGATALCGPEAESFLQNYLFDVSPTTDDRPYFSHFFRWNKASGLFRHLGREWLPMIELGYLFIVAALAQAVLAGVAMILLPLLFLRSVEGKFIQKRAKSRCIDISGILLYFGSIGMAFMFFEMALLPKYTLLLSQPVYAAAMVLSTVLIMAGCGSLSVRYFQTTVSWFLWIPVFVMIAWVVMHLIIGDRLFYFAMNWSFGARIAYGIAILSVLSFFLGWPFPSGLRLIADRSPGLVPWAWGVNGCASVIGAVLGKILAISLGLKSLMLCACFMYLIAVIIFYLIVYRKDDGIDA